MSAEDDYKSIADACTLWWRRLQGLTDGGKEIPGKSPDRAALAQLRRIGVIDLSGIPAVDTASALSISAFRELIHRLRGIPPGNYWVRRWLGIESAGSGARETIELSPFAIAAATLAHIRADAGGQRCGVTAKALGAGEDDARLFAEARFKRLIRTRNDWPGLLAQARRIAALLGKEKAPVGDLGASLILWNADPHITRDWAFQYYQKDYAIPEREAEPATV
jgi:hypothetical protein